MSFITIDKLNGSSGETISTITVPEYQGLEDRTQSFKVVVDGKEVFVNIQQKAFKPSLTTNKQVVPFTQEVLTQSLQITSNFNWEARTDSSWFTLSQTEGNKGTTTIEISTSSIDSPIENRNGTINFYFGDTFVTAITVKQEFEVIFEVSTTSINMTDETTATINVTSNVDWYCNTDITWINLDIVQGFGDKTITVTAQEYTGQDRNGYIHFYVDGELKKSVNIYQTIEVVEVPTDVENCFYIEPYNLGETITIRISIEANSIVYIYSVDGTNTWTKYDEPGFQIKIDTKKRIYIKQFKYNREINDKPLRISGLYRIGGNIETLLGEMKENYVGRLFELSSIVDASNLILPATTLADSCYESMFYRCTSLVTAPALPATTLAYRCYSYMFEDCSSLVNAPELPATTLADSCYLGMFYSCLSLVNAPALPATELASGCYSSMFKNCTSLVNAPELPATNLTKLCYFSMFNGCSSLINAPALPATTLLNECYKYMFQDCTSLVNAPKLSATTLTDYCYSYMFNGCSSLVNAPELPATTLAGNCYTYMFGRCTSLVTAPALPATTLAYGCYSYMFEDCSSLVNAPKLSATTLVNNCYSDMFRGCGKLNNITMLATDISADWGLYYWVSGVSSNGTFIKKQGVNIPSGVSGIPEGWTVIEV